MRGYIFKKMQKAGLFCAAVACLFTGCASNKFDIPLADEDKVHVNLFRFDLAFDSLRLAGSAADFPSFIARYPQWLDMYSNQIIRTGDIHTALFPERVSAFFSYPEYADVTRLIQQTFPAKSGMEGQLSQAFSYFHHYFPEKNIPDVYTYNGGFNQSVVIDKGIVGCGLDKYLGANCDYYFQLGIDQYKIDKMRPEQVPVDILMAHFLGEFSNTYADDNVLSEIIHEGCKMYLLNACFPFLPDSTLWGMPASKISWLENSERSMWEYMIDKKVLFNTEYLMIKKFTGDGPFTAPFSKDSPARAAVWVGYRIVSQYMEKSGSSMNDLFAVSDYQHILNKSKYNP